MIVFIHSEEEQKEINKRAVAKVKYNRWRLGNIPKEYENITWALNYRGKAFYYTLLRLYTHVETLDCISVHNHDVFWISGDYAKEVCQTTKAPQHLAFACCVGIIDKVKPGFTAPPDMPQWQTFTKEPDGNGLTFQGVTNLVSDQMEKSRRQKLPKKKDKNQEQEQSDPFFYYYPVNVFVMPKLTAERMAWIDQKIGECREHGITFSNICFDVLKYEGMEEDAKRVYLHKADEESLDRKEELWAKIDFMIDVMIQESEYCYKDDIRESLKATMKKHQFDQLWRMFVVQGRSQYRYHPPKNSDKERLGLTSDKWIVERQSIN